MLFFEIKSLEGFLINDTLSRLRAEESKDLIRIVGVVSLPIGKEENKSGEFRRILLIILIRIIVPLEVFGKVDVVDDVQVPLYLLDGGDDVVEPPLSILLVPHSPRKEGLLDVIDEHTKGECNHIGDIYLHPFHLFAMW